MLKCLKIVFGFPFALAFCKAVWKNIPKAKYAKSERELILESSTLC